MSATAAPEELEILIDVRSATESGRAVELRIGAGLSQGEIARAVGVTRACVSRWEAGTRRPRGDAAVRYGRVLKALDPHNGESQAGNLAFAKDTPGLAAYGED